MSRHFTIELADWSTAHALVAPLRQRVFVDEQRVPLELELDDMDAHCLHAIASTGDGAVIGTGRLLPHGHIGRMAVSRTARGNGVGSAILQALIDAARRRGFRQVILSSQTHATGFYAQHGFLARGEIYMDAGIPHIDMTLDLEA